MAKVPVSTVIAERSSRKVSNPGNFIVIMCGRSTVRVTGKLTSRKRIFAEYMSALIRKPTLLIRRGMKMFSFVTRTSSRMIYVLVEHNKVIIFKIERCFYKRSVDIVIRIGEH